MDGGILISFVVALCEDAYSGLRYRLMMMKLNIKLEKLNTRRNTMVSTIFFPELKLLD